MLASVLNSARAIKVSIYIVRAFIKLRELLASHKNLAQQLAKLERQSEKHDTQIRSLFEAIDRLMAPPESKQQKIGFRP